MSCPLPRGDPSQLAPARFIIASRSTKVRVVAISGAEPSVEGATLHQQQDGSLTVLPSRCAGHEVLLVCPENSDVAIGTASGRVELVGLFGNTRIVTSSGRVEVDRASSLDIRSTSASVTVGQCEGMCRIATTSGGVHIGSAGQAEVSAVSSKIIIDDTNAASVRTVSGSVTVGCSTGGHAHVRTVSGTVDISVPAAATPAISLRSISGKIRCDCEPTPGDDGELNVKTVSGSIRVSIR